MKKLLVPVDFSQHSEYALEVAADIAKRQNAELLVLHMLEMSDNLLTASDKEQKPKALFFLRLAEQKFEEFLDKPYLKDVQITPIVKHYKVFSEVNDVAKDHHVDLIVMGSHGVSGFNEIFVGSNTEKVVRYSEIPVLVIKQHLTNVDFKTAVFACDFTEESINAYQNATHLLKQFNADIHWLYVNIPGQNFKSTTQMEEDVQDFLNMADGNLNNLPNVHYVADTSVEKGILYFAKKIKADLIAIPTHGRKGLAHFFEGSISEDLANHANLPVLTFKI